VAYYRVVLSPNGDGAEHNDSKGQTHLLTDIDRALVRAGIPDDLIFAHRPQRTAAGARVSAVLPDRSFRDLSGRRRMINVEVDVTPRDVDRSMRKYLTGANRLRDPAARHVFVRADRDTGRVVETVVLRQDRIGGPLLRRVFPGRLPLAALTGRRDPRVIRGGGTVRLARPVRRR
jgi:hypothetical protein